jgi:uncharacterized protein (DUF885 family)
VTPERTIDALSEQFVAEYAALDPLAATYFGISGHDDKMTDLSPAGFAAREELVAGALARVTAATPVDDREKVAREAFLERQGLQVELAEAGMLRSQFSVIVSGVHTVRQVFDLMPTDTEADWANISVRLGAVQEALQGYRITLAEEANRGNASATRQYTEVARQICNWTGQIGGTGDLFANLVAGSGTEGGLRADLERNAAAATRALADFGMFLEDEMEPRGRANEACGREHYALASREYLGATVDLEQTYDWGWEELKRLADDMSATADRILPGANLEEAVACLEADPTRIISGKDAFRGWMQELAERTIEELNGVHFDIPQQIRRIECCLAPTNDGGIYYTGPSEDFVRPGRMWWAVPDGITDFTPWREVTTVYHEGVPGHHLQIGQTTVGADLLNRWQRLMCWVSGHGEGWALYAERLMDELGYLADPADRLGMLDGQSFRAARVVVDLGMHLGLEIPRDNPFGFHPGERWTPALGFEFMRQHCTIDDATLRFEVNRYLGWPGQAPAYKVGERIWLEARAEARKRQGADFDLKEFHRSALELGSIGLDPLKAALARL